MRVMYFRCHGRLYRVNEQSMGVGGSRCFVLDPAGRQHVEGIRAWWSCVAQRPDAEGLGRLLQAAVKDRTQRW